MSSSSSTSFPPSFIRILQAETLRDFNEALVNFPSEAGQHTLLDMRTKEVFDLLLDKIEDFLGVRSSCDSDDGEENNQNVNLLYRNFGDIILQWFCCGNVVPSFLHNDARIADIFLWLDKYDKVADFPNGEFDFQPGEIISYAVLSWAERDESSDDSEDDESYYDENPREKNYYLQFRPLQKIFNTMPLASIVVNSMLNKTTDKQKYGRYGAALINMVWGNDEMKELFVRHPQIADALFNDYTPSRPLAPQPHRATMLLALNNLTWNTKAGLEVFASDPRTAEILLAQFLPTHKWFTHFEPSSIASAASSTANLLWCEAGRRLLRTEEIIKDLQKALDGACDRMRDDVEALMEMQTLCCQLVTHEKYLPWSEEDLVKYKNNDNNSNHDSSSKREFFLLRKFVLPLSALVRVADFVCEVESNIQREPKAIFAFGNPEFLRDFLELEGNVDGVSSDTRNQFDRVVEALNAEIERKQQLWEGRRNSSNV